ncbi:hypothetical protein BLOT_003687 [Blomia tropicalis]|nr:hypothetical protein BLOT_003687 [Blomia tropicalis]
MFENFIEPNRSSTYDTHSGSHHTSYSCAVMSFALLAILPINDQTLVIGHTVQLLLTILYNSRFMPCHPSVNQN